MTPKPLGHKAYLSIPHLPMSRMGAGDHHCDPHQAQIATATARDRHDRVIVQEKLDGSCMAVARLDGAIVALSRAGHPAWSSPYRQHQLFAVWVAEHWAVFHTLLAEGERAVGEWLVQAHGTRYHLPHAPFVLFDLMQGKGTRAPFDEVVVRAQAARLPMPRLIADGPPCSVATVQAALATSGHGALDPVEGAVWRVEYRGAVNFLVKWVRPDKQDGYYLPARGATGSEVWNHWPGDAIATWHRPQEERDGPG